MVYETLKTLVEVPGVSGFEEEIKGSIEPGKVADLIVISRDILTIPEDQIKEVEAEMTVIDGKIVYEK